MNTDRNRKVKVKMLTVDANCLGCGDGGKAVIYYNPDEERFESTDRMERETANKYPRCPGCNGKIKLKFSETATYMATMPRTLNRIRTCRSCDFTHEDKRFVLPGKWEDLTNELPYCPRCRGAFDSEFTESDTKWYTSLPINQDRN